MPDMQTPPRRGGAYIFELECPHCGLYSEVVALKERLPASLFCDECIRRHSEIVELRIVRVTVAGVEPWRSPPQYPSHLKEDDDGERSP